MGKVKLIFAGFLFLFLFSINAFAHGGRTDECGGHNDKKNSGYHIHNHDKYCICYPEDVKCKNAADESEQKQSDKQKPGNKENQPKE